jgi:uncharacterized Zn-finger protein
MIKVPDKYDHLKKVYVDTTHVVTQLDHPRVYYTIKPEIGYVICGYSNTCFVLQEDADLDTEKMYVYDERERIRLEKQVA